MEYFKQLYYLRLLSLNLTKFKENQDGVWNCRCPVCGDSKKDKNKARGYFFRHEGGIVYKCHNCSYSSSLLTLIKNHFRHLYNEILMDMYSSKEKEKKALTEEVRGVLEGYEKQRVKHMRVNDYLKGYKTFNLVADDNPLKQYLINRGLADYLDRFYYIPNTREFIKDVEHYKNRGQIGDLAGIGIPHFSQDKTRLEFMQLRYIEGDVRKRYITFRIEALESTTKVFGLERLNFDAKYISITEGAFDSLFADNCIATSGISDYKNVIKLLDSKGVSREKIRYIIDTDWKYNKQVRKSLNDIVSMGCSVVILPKHIHEKDLNDMILGGLSRPELNDMLDEYTYNGLGANLAMAKAIG